MTTYQTTYSDLSNLPKHERKQKETNFPYKTPNSNLGNLDLCGQIVSKYDIGNNIKFCPICDFPMIVRMMIMPCEHVICYSCSQPPKDFCFICEGKIETITRLNDKTKLYECDFPDCFKFFSGIENLNIHKFKAHGIMVEGFNMNNPVNIGLPVPIMAMNKPGMVYPTAPVQTMGFMGMIPPMGVPITGMMQNTGMVTQPLQSQQLPSQI